MRSLLWFLLALVVLSAQQIDPSGYVVFCPCMGRFGNQVDQLLGVMRFTRMLNRTLVLPNFIEYPFPNTVMTPFENIFQVAEIKKYQKVVTMVEFTRDVMPKIWPKEKRTAVCWSPHQSIYDKEAPMGCHPKEGNPFGPYWDKIGVSFVNDSYFGDIPGGFDLSVNGSKAEWIKRFSAEEYPVLAFPSPPAPFPSHSNVAAQQHFVYHFFTFSGPLAMRNPYLGFSANENGKNVLFLKFSKAAFSAEYTYLKWNSRIIGRANQFIKEELTRPYIGIHLRNDKDWERVCEHIQPHQPLFGSAQCDIQEHYDGTLTKEICAPSETTVIEQLVEMVGKIGAKSVFVSSDKDHMIEALNEALQAYEVRAHRLNPDDPFVSLAILGKADHFIGNCVSTFSHIVKRERDNRKQRLPTTYFGIRDRTKRIEL